MQAEPLSKVLDGELGEMLPSSLAPNGSLSRFYSYDREQFRNSASLIEADRQDSQYDLNLDQLDGPEMSRIERYVWIFSFFFMILVATGGNVIVVYIVSTNKEMKSVTNYFLVNLSLADTMVSLLNVTFNFISMLNSNWPFGLIYCKISNFIAILSISASVFTLTAISCDRYHAILYPLRPRMSHSHAIGWILLIWSLSSLLAMPNLIYSELHLVNEDKQYTSAIATAESSSLCTLIWPDGQAPKSSYDHAYNILILLFTYVVPISTMAILYYRVGKELWGYEAIGEDIDGQHRTLMAKKKIVKMMIIVVIIFALCWLPYHAFFVVNFYFPNLTQENPVRYQRLYLVCYWLAMSNSMYNPMVIYFMNSNFKHQIRACICCICCCRQYQRPGSKTRGSLYIRNTSRLTSKASRRSNLTTASSIASHGSESIMGNATGLDALEYSPVHQTELAGSENSSQLRPTSQTSRRRVSFDSPDAMDTRKSIFNVHRDREDIVNEEEDQPLKFVEEVGEIINESENESLKRGEPDKCHV